MVFKWRDNQTEKFVELYREYECLWRVGNKLYRNRDAREAAYSKMCERMNLPDLNVHDVKTKIKTVRTTYKFELNKILKAKRNGASYVPQLFWFKTADAFLRNVTVQRRINAFMNAMEVEENAEDQESANNNETAIVKADSNPWGGETIGYSNAEAQETEGHDNTYLLVVHSEVQDGTTATHDATAEAATKPTPLKPRPIRIKPMNPSPVDASQNSKCTTETGSVKRRENGEVKVMISRQKSSSQLFGEYLVSKLESYSDYVRNVVQHEINEIIFQADMGSYDGRTFQPTVVAVTNS